MGRKARLKQLHSPLSARADNPPASSAMALPRASAPASWSQEWAAHWRTAALLFAAALLVRGFLLARIAHTPYFNVENIDSKAYQLWAEQILAGHWLPPQHFYQSPLYAYYLAIVYGAFGSSTWVPRVIQIALGSLSVTLLYAIGTALFSRRVGVLAAMVLCLYGPAILEEIVLAKTALVICSALLSFALFLYALPRNRLPVMGAAGALLGVTIIGAGQWLPALLLLGIYAASAPDIAPVRRAGAAAAFVAAGVLTILPVVCWNSYWGGGFMLTSGDAGLNLYSGNNPLATGLPSRPPGLRDIPEYEEADARRLAERDVGHALTPAAVSRYWSRRALAFAVAHPADFLIGMERKFLVLWNGYEVPDSYQYTFMRQEFIPALWACFSFGTIGPPALLGMVLFWRRRTARPLYVVCWAYLATVLLFYVRSRYRMPAVPFLILFAAAAVDWLVTALINRQWRRVLGAGAVLVASAIFVDHAYCEPARGNVRALCLSGDVWFDLEWMKLAAWYKDQGDHDRELAYLYRAAECSTPRSPGQIYYWIGELELQRGSTASAANDPAAAQRHLRAAEAAYRRCVSERYRLPYTYVNLSAVYRRLDRTDQALQAMDAALRAGPNNVDVLLRAERLHVELGQCAPAQHLAERITQRSPHYSEAQRLLATCVSR